ncbi:MAG: alpha/beta fold hydrolase [Gemmatimonadota bacterium]
MKSMTRYLYSVLAVLLTAGNAGAQEAGDAEGRDARDAATVAGLEYEVHGTGEPILFIHGSYMEDALRPIIDEAALEGYRRIHYDRAGYGDSPERAEAFSFARGAADAEALLRHLDIDGAHVVGYSLGGVIAVELARSAPDVVRSLVLIEPPLPLAGLADGPPPQFLIDGAELWQAGDHDGAIDIFFTAVASPAWKSDVARGLPGGVEEVSRNAHLFFEHELPAFEGYLLDEADFTETDRPILYVVGDSESPYGRTHHDRIELVESWVSELETVVVDDADHALPMQQPGPIAHAVAAFVGRHGAGAGDTSPQAEAELRAVIEDIAADIMTGNVDGLQGIHLDSEKFTKFGPRTFERQDVESTNASEIAFFTSISNVEYRVEDLKIDVFGDVGIATYYPHVSFTRDGETVTVRGRQTLVFLETSDGWKIVHEHGTVRD